MRPPIDRRAFIKHSLIAAVAAATVRSQSSAAVQTEIKRAGPSRKVIVIGAGLAGLSAAFELVQAGHDVTVLEARARPGGRVYTMRGQFAEDLYAEAGATNVFDVHDWTMKYVKLLGVALDPETSSTGAPIFYLRGKRLVIKSGSPVDWPLDLRADERGKTRRELWAKYVVPVLKEIGDPAASGWPSAALKRFDRMTFAEFLRFRGASEDATALLSLGLADQLGEGAGAVSALNLLREAAPRALVKEVSVIRGGSDTFPKAFATRLGGRIHYGAAALKIEHDARGVRVICGPSEAPRSFAGDYLICAIPFTVLRGVAVAPGFSAEKQKAIAQLGNTSVVRVFLQTRKRFWLDEGLSGSATTDLPIVTAYDKASYLPGTRGMLEAYVAGARARQLAAMTDADRLEFTTRQMEKVLPAIREYYEGGASVCWDNDEWARGAYAWFKPGEMDSLLPHIARSEGRIHFAGDHTSPWPGWMNGALQSGHRAAREVAERPT